MHNIFIIANTENKTIEYLSYLKRRANRLLPKGFKRRVYLPCAVHSYYYLLKDLKRMKTCDIIIPLEDGHTDLYTDILIYHFNRIEETKRNLL